MTVAAVDLDVVRELLRAAVGDPAAEWPALTIGSIIGQLDQAAAVRAHTYAQAFGDLITVELDDDGAIRLVGIEQVAA